ncbi:MAG: hypothetical protein J7K75_08090 [Desulfuromonas sp.]|nr:hypothetical protein [Desulfuromonas sp.]
MLVNREQQAVFLLAHVVIRSNNLSVPILLSGQAIHYRNTGRPTKLDWAIDYIMCLPDDSEDQKLLHNLHLEPTFQWTPEQTRRAAACNKAFYHRLKDNRAYAIGIKWLNSEGRAQLERFASAQAMAQCQ